MLELWSAPAELHDVVKEDVGISRVLRGEVASENKSTASV
jgi:hypothetical protein